MKPLMLAVVDDSTFMRKALARLLADESRIVVVGQAASGEELIENLDRWKPDAITLDLCMPGMGGLETLRHVMRERPVPVVILSTHSAKDAPLTIEALHQGAVDFIDKQEYSLVDFEALRQVLVEKLLNLPIGRAAPVPDGLPPARTAPPAEDRAPLDASPVFELLLIGASTGGPPAIQAFLEGLGGAPPVPVAVVQHMPLGFTKPFAERLNAHLPMRVKEASHIEPLLPGTVYIAPSGLHLRVKEEGKHIMGVLASYPETAAHRPSVDVLFESAAAACGRHCLAALLTGMGQDGAQGMLRLHRTGACTIGQSAESCVVYGMPKAAADLGAVSLQLNIREMASHVARLLGQR